MKALKKKMLLDEDEVEHTKAERDILISNNHPFLVNYWILSFLINVVAVSSEWANPYNQINMKFSFQNETRIFFVLVSRIYSYILN